MPLAWFSELENRRYHVCLECSYEEVFDNDTIVVDDEDKVLLKFPHLTLCERCSRRRFSVYLICTVTDNYSDVRRKLNLQ